MGLDMYLYRRTDVKNWSFQTPKEQHKVKVTLNNKKHPYIDPEKVCYVEEEVGYWRKANAIHKWFVDNCQDGVDDCKSYNVETSQLTELLDICKQIKEDHSKAEELLPPQAGFFFGSTDIDDSYFQDIDDTITILQPIVDLSIQLNKGLNNDTDYPEYQYASSW